MKHSVAIIFSVLFIASPLASAQTISCTYTSASMRSTTVDLPSPMTIDFNLVGKSKLTATLVLGQSEIEALITNKNDNLIFYAPNPQLSDDSSAAFAAISNDGSSSLNFYIFNGNKLEAQQYYGKCKRK